MNHPSNYDCLSLLVQELEYVLLRLLNPFTKAYTFLKEVEKKKMINHVYI